MNTFKNSREVNTAWTCKDTSKHSSPVFCAYVYSAAAGNDCEHGGMKVWLYSPW